MNPAALLKTIVAALLQAAPATAPSTQPDSFTVAADGSAKYHRIQDAINDCPQLSDSDPEFSIFIRPGTYKELIYVQREKRRIKLIGAGADSTIITYDLNANMKGVDDQKIGTFRTPTVTIDADDFDCEGLTFQNSAGRVGQALAIRIDGDRVRFERCRFIGYQDTIFGNRGRQYFKDCYIAGAVDFIFGGATEFFDRCEIHAVAGGYLTAPSTPQEQKFGYVFDHCRITSEPDVKTFLARPWRAYSAAAYLNCELGDCINPIGWNNWGKREREKTARYAEYKNTGPGADLAKRADWSTRLTDEQAQRYDKANVLAGWTP